MFLQSNSEFLEEGMQNLVNVLIKCKQKDIQWTETTTFCVISHLYVHFMITHYVWRTAVGNNTIKNYVK